MGHGSWVTISTMNSWGSGPWMETVPVSAIECIGCAKSWMTIFRVSSYSYGHTVLRQGFGAMVMDRTSPYEFIGFGAMDDHLSHESHEFIWIGGMGYGVWVWVTISPMIS